MIRKVQTKLNQCLFLNAKHSKTAFGQICKYNALFFLTGQVQGMKNYSLEGILLKICSVCTGASCAVAVFAI